MKKLAVLILAVSLLISGCSWMDGSYVHVTRHQDQGSELQIEALTVSNYSELQQVIMQMVESGTAKGVIFLSEYAQTMAEDGMSMICDRLTSSDPLGSYAVERLEYEIGTNSGKPAIAVDITYRRTPMEIQQVQRVGDIDQATRAIAEALSQVDTGIVLLISRYKDVDFAQLVYDYAQNHPEIVMEIPQVTTAVYGSGESRVVDLQIRPAGIPCGRCAARWSLSLRLPSSMSAKGPCPIRNTPSSTPSSWSGLTTGCSAPLLPPTACSTTASVTAVPLPSPMLPCAAVWALTVL